MTAAHEQNIEAKKRRSRFVTQAQLVGHKMSGKRKRQWDEIVGVVVTNGGHHVLSFFPEETEEQLVDVWKRQCQFAGIGTGILSWFFWNFFLPYLVELAKNWIESQRNADAQQGPVGER